MQFTRILVLYFVMGAVMFGGGAVSFDNTGPTQYFIDYQDGQATAADEPQEGLSGFASAITSLVGQVGGVAVLVWNLVAGTVAFMNWPLTVMLENNVPISVSVLLGGTPTVMFYGGLIRLIRSSA